MAGHWRMERRLRRERPEIPSELLDTLIARTTVPRARRTLRMRLGAAAGAAVLASIVAGALGGYSYAASVASATGTFVSHVVSPPKTTPAQLKSHGPAQIGLAGPAAVYAPQLSGVSCKNSGNHLNALITGQSTDSTAADTISATITPSGSGSTAGAVSWTIHVNDPTGAPGTSVTVTQTNGAGSSTVTVSCT